MSKQNKILLVGSTFYCNRGCEAIVRGTVNILSEALPGSKFVVSGFRDTLTDELETDPRIYHRPPGSDTKRFSTSWWKYRVRERYSDLGKKWLATGEFKQQFECLVNSDIALQVGGDNYTLDYGDIQAFTSLDNVLWTAGKPMVLWGASVGPFSNDPQIENSLADHLQKFSLIVVRETESQKYLQSIAVTDNVCLAADPAFALEPKEPSLSDKFASFFDGNSIGLNVSPLMENYGGASNNDLIEMVSDCVELLLKGPNRVLLIPHVICENNDDHALMQGVMERLKVYDDKLAVLPPTLTASEYKWAIAQMQVFVGARTHSTIAAISSCVPTISLGYSSKSRGLNQDVFGHVDWLLPFSEVTPQRLAEITQTLIAKESDVRKSLNSIAPSMLAKAKMAGRQVAGLLKS